MSYAQKLEHYLKENLFVKSLHPKAYENDSNFLGMAKTLGIPFKAHKCFTKTDIDERQALVQRICEVIWGERDTEQVAALNGDPRNRTQHAAPGGQLPSNNLPTDG